MSEKKVRQRLISRFYESLDKMDVTDNYAATVQKLEGNGITLVKATPKKPNIFAFTYAALLLFLCLLTGYIGFDIGGKDKLSEDMNLAMREYLDDFCEDYYKKPILTGYYSDKDIISVYVGLVREGNSLGINYFYYIMTFDTDLEFIFKNVDKSEETVLSGSPTRGNLSSTLDIDDGDEIQIEIRGYGKNFYYSFTAYFEIHKQLVEKQK
jgi:hypothetical protein